MNTVKDMSKEFLIRIYELSVFLRLKGHASLGERIMTCAVEITNMSNVSWASNADGHFLENIIKAYEMSDKLIRLMDIVEYLKLDYKGFEKTRDSALAIFRMSRASVNTTFEKMNAIHTDQVIEDEGPRPSDAVKNGEQEVSPEMPSGDIDIEETPPSEEDSETGSVVTDDLPFVMNREGMKEEEPA